MDANTTNYITASGAGLVTVVGALLTWRTQRLQTQQKAESEQRDNALKWAGNSHEQAMEMVERLQAQAVTDRARLVEAEIAVDKLRDWYRRELERNDKLEQQHRENQQKIKELDIKLGLKERKRP